MIVIIIVSGCSITKNSPAKSFVAHSGTLNDPVQVTLQLSRAPKPGETADIILASYIHAPTFQIDPQNLDSMHAWLEFNWANIQGSYSEAEMAVPVSWDEVQVKGDPSWQGTIREGETIELHSTIKLPREGVWAISGYFTGEGWQKPVTTQMRIAVTKDAAAIIGTPDFYHSSLVYLGYIGYGQGDDRTLSLSKSYPVILILDISKAPRPGEEVTLTCNIHSFYDISDFPAQITFMKRIDSNNLIKVSADNLLVNGSLNWTGNLPKGANQFSTVIRFPEEGDWEIHVQSDYPMNGQPGFADNLRLHVSNNLSYYGWKN